MTKLSDQGIELSEGGVIEYPDDNGTIRRRDVHGNVEEVRRPGEDGFNPWALKCSAMPTAPRRSFAPSRPISSTPLTPPTSSLRTMPARREVRTGSST